MPLTTTDKIGLGQLGLSGLSGLLGGMDNSAEEATQEQRDQELFNLLLQAVANQGDTERTIGQDNLTRAAGFAGQNPLGAEFNFRQNNALKRGGIEALGGRQLAHGTPNLAAGFMDRPGVRESMSDDAVNQAIQQRRIATAGLDPRAAAQIGGTEGYATQLMHELQAQQGAQRGSADRMLSMIQERQAQQAQAEQQDGPGFWKKLGGTLLPIAGLAANFIPGVGPLASMAIAAGTGAAGGALAGGKKGALIGAGANTAASYGMNKMGLGQDKPPVINNAMSSASLPTSMQQAAVQAPGAGQLQLGSTPLNADAGGFMAAIGMDRPNVAQPQIVRNRPQVSLPPMNMAVSHGPSAPMSPASAQPQNFGPDPMSVTKMGFADQLAAGGATPRMGGNINLPSPAQAIPQLLSPVASHRSAPQVPPTVIHPSGQVQRITPQQLPEFLKRGWKLVENKPVTPFNGFSGGRSSGGGGAAY